MARTLTAVLLALLALAAPARAQEPSAQLRASADQVVALLRGEAEPEAIFTPAFLAAVPAAQLRTFIGQLQSEHGRALRVARIDPRSQHAAAIEIETERALVRMNLSVEAGPRHRIEGLLVTGADVRGDTLEAVAAELRALPGQVSFAVARLGDGAPELIGAIDPERPLAIGSTFKLILLAELSRQVQAGERRWNDVVTLDHRSLPSGQLQNWPPGSPVTLHTLAALMISISDNTATDTLLHQLGRERVERLMATLGLAAAGRNRPFLGTLELFALKAATDADFAAWRGADEAGRRRLLDRYGAVRAETIDPTLMVGRPLRIEAVEWFASASDLVRVMDWLRRHGDETARAILSISPGVAGGGSDGFAWLGFKGGSEPGVINLTWLACGRGGGWRVVTGSWNDPDQPVDEARFIGLMRRALQLAR